MKGRSCEPRNPLIDSTKPQLNNFPTNRLVLSGIAYIYDRSSGKQTASGEQLDEHALTAAHRSLLASMTAKDRNVSGWSYR